MSIKVGAGGRVLLHCFAGCGFLDIVAALGLKPADLAGHPGTLPPRVNPPRSPRREVDAVPGAEETARMRAFVADAAARVVAGGEQHPASIYARGRFGLRHEDVVRFRLGYTDRLGGGGRLVVPFASLSGALGVWQARAFDRNVRPPWLTAPDPQVGAWASCGWFRGPAPDAPVVLCEGPGDALAAVSAGCHGLALRGAGLALNREVQRTVAAWTSGASAVLLAGDGDPAGEQFTSTLLAVLAGGTVPVRPLRFPPGTDLAELRELDHNRVVRWLHANTAAARTGVAA